MKRLFSGIQPTGNLHIGNYLGAIRHWVELQDRFDSIFCVVDLHAITIQQDPHVLRAKTREVAGLLLAAGINPQRSALFVQSHVCAHAELAWIVNCLTPMGWMERMTQFKEKSAAMRERSSVGLFDYPALMAADILLYRAEIVPVGEDQKQHLELARDVARRFNVTYGETLTLPEPLIPALGARIMSLDDPTRKMSKSEARAGGAIELLDPPEAIVAKIKRAATDPLRDVRFDPARPGVYNLLVIYELLTGQSRQEIEERFAGQGYAVLKQALADVVIETLRPLQARYREWTAEPGAIDALLADGAARVRPLAQETLAEVKQKMGLG